jgi:hypothetical protein
LQRRSDSPESTRRQLPRVHQPRRRAEPRCSSSILAVAFVVVVIRINGQLVSLVSQLLQLATAVGLSLLMIIMICVLVIVIMLHG